MNSMTPRALTTGLGKNLGWITAYPAVIRAMLFEQEATASVILFSAFEEKIHLLSGSFKLDANEVWQSGRRPSYQVIPFGTFREQVNANRITGLTEGGLGESQFLFYEKGRWNSEPEFNFQVLVALTWGIPDFCYQIPEGLTKTVTQFIQQ